MKCATPQMKYDSVFQLLPYVPHRNNKKAYCINSTYLYSVFFPLFDSINKSHQNNNALTDDFLSMHFSNKRNIHILHMSIYLLRNHTIKMHPLNSFGHKHFNFYVVFIYTTCILKYNV